MILANGQYAIGKFIPEGSIIVPSRPSEAHSWNGTQWVFDGYTKEVVMNHLRFERNRILAQTDWRATVDYPKNDQTEWLTYRQTLRDLPQNSSPELDENGNLINVNWPEEPQ